mgnify:CR=1 FL=1
MATVEPFVITNGLLSQARQMPSPNCDERPNGFEISLLVIHCISLPPGSYGGDAIERFFKNELPTNEHPYFENIAGLKVSAHLLIKRTGEVIQFVNFNRRAWHAGVSCLEARECCNDFSIGIELEGLDNTQFTQQQYIVLASITKQLRSHYPAIKRKNLVGHEHIAPDRKADPGSGFDWVLYRNFIE